MHCPKCKSNSIYIMDTFPGLDNSVYRRRKCKECGNLFRTAETIPTDEAFAEAYRKAYRPRGNKKERHA